MNLTRATRSHRSVFARYQTNMEGQISLMMATLFSTLALCVAVTVDLTSTFSTKIKMQEALDEAVKEAALHVDESDFAASGTNVYTTILDDKRLEGITVSFEKLESGDTNEVVGTASGSLPLIFSGIFKNSDYDITVRSVVHLDSATAASKPALPDTKSELEF